MKFLVLSLVYTALLVLLPATLQSPVGTPNGITIESAPSVVAYQGSSQTHTQFVISPMGRSLGRLEAAISVNRTHQVSPHDTNITSTSMEGLEHLDVLSISPVYTPY